MPPTFHYRPEPQPTFTYTEIVNNVKYTCRVTSAPGQIYWDDTWVKLGELTPTFVHTTTTVSSDGSVDAQAKESTHQYHKPLGTYHYPAFLQ
jgi:hypothetical protein